MSVAVESKFRSRDFYRATDAYRLLPFHFLQFTPDEKILVNEVGEHLFLQNRDFDALVEHRLDRTSSRYLDLKGKHFLSDSESPVALELLATKYRTKKAHLAGFTKL